MQGILTRQCMAVLQDTFHRYPISQFCWSIAAPGIALTHDPLIVWFAVYFGMNLYFQKVKKTYRPLATYTNNSKNTEAGSFTADLDSAEEV